MRGVAFAPGDDAVLGLVGPLVPNRGSLRARSDLPQRRQLSLLDLRSGAVRWTVPIGPPWLPIDTAMAVDAGSGTMVLHHGALVELYRSPAAGAAPPADAANRAETVLLMPPGETVAVVARRAPILSVENGLVPASASAIPTRSLPSMLVADLVERRLLLDRHAADAALRPDPLDAEHAPGWQAGEERLYGQLATDRTRLVTPLGVVVLPDRTDGARGAPGWAGLTPSRP